MSHTNDSRASVSGRPVGNSCRNSGTARSKGRGTPGRNQAAHAAPRQPMRGRRIRVRLDGAFTRGDPMSSTNTKGAHRPPAAANPRSAPTVAHGHRQRDPMSGSAIGRRPPIVQGSGARASRPKHGIEIAIRRASARSTRLLGRRSTHGSSCRNLARTRSPTSPPSTAIRSRMPCQAGPDPVRVASNPIPSSATVNSSAPSSLAERRS